MINIDLQKCIGCGNCVKDCFPGKIEMKNDRPAAKAEPCMECGHCIAVCPVNAISLPGYDMSEVLEYKPKDVSIEPGRYLNHLKSRRSIRRFKETPVTEEQLDLIMEAGRFSPTGGNLQNVDYFVSQKEVNTLKDLIMEQLKDMGELAKKTGSKVSWYSDLWLEMYDQYKKKQIDKLFFDAGTVIAISSNSPQSALIAAAHMETMIYSLGLGMLYSGFTARAVAASQTLRQYLELKDGYEVYAVLVIGEPDVRYFRTVPRKPANIIRK